MDTSQLSRSQLIDILGDAGFSPEELEWWSSDALETTVWQLLKETYKGN